MGRSRETKGGTPLFLAVSYFGNPPPPNADGFWGPDVSGAREEPGGLPGLLGLPGVQGLLLEGEMGVNSSQVWGQDLGSRNAVSGFRSSASDSLLRFLALAEREETLGPRNPQE